MSVKSTNKHCSHVVIVTNLFPNPQEKTKGQFIFQLVEHLKEKTIITVISPIPFFPKINFFKNIPLYKFSQIPSIEKQKGYDVHFCRHLVFPKLGFLTPFFLFFPLLLKVLKIQKDSPISILNAHWIFPDGVACSFIGKFLQIPTILSARGCDVNLYPKLFGRYSQIKKALLRSSAVTAVCDDLKNQIITLGIPEEKIETIPNGINLNNFRPLDKKHCRKQLNAEKSGNILLFIGSLDEVKATHYLIRAFFHISKQEAKCKLWIVGEGPLKKKLQDLAEELGIDDKVTFFHPQPHHLIPVFMGACDVFCLPSIREGRPNVIIEALASGRPVIATNIGGIPELIQHGYNGYLFEAGDVDALVQFILKALQQVWSSEKIRGSVEHLKWSESAQAYLKLYQAITSVA
ncbi:glycosyltransferase family 4 protein [Candidatus Parcubacteria bacterium]|nr:MAG: glycosyltransferase family 4 protein [Candidatus Parcubacteria bacterium]